MLVDYQRENLEKLKSEVRNNNSFIIVGTPNSGRKHVIKEWGMAQKNACIIQIEKTNSNQRYASLTIKLKEIFKDKKIKGSISPNISVSLQNIFVGIGFGGSKKDNFLFEEEQNIYSYLCKLVRKHTLIFIVDSSLGINDGSIEIIDSFMKKHRNRILKKNSVFKFILAPNDIPNSYNVYFKDLTNTIINREKLLNDLNLNPNIGLSDNVKEFIFSNISSNIGLLIDIINSFNNNQLDFNLNLFDTNNLTRDLLVQGTRNYKYIEQLNELMTICSITKYYFKSIDLAYVLKENETIIMSYLEYAREHYLLYNNKEGYTVAFELIRKIYECSDGVKKIRIYTSIINMISDLYPSDYSNKYIFAKLADDKYSNTYLMQHIFKEIRLKHNINIVEFKNDLSAEEYNIIVTYNKAFGYINSKKYTDAIGLLNTLKNLSGALFYEINLLKSQCKIKEIEPQSREFALNCLSYNNNDTYIDENLRYRLAIRKTAALVHVGKYNNAIINSSLIENHLREKIKETGAIEYEYYLNVIYRKYSYIHEYDLSINEVETSVNFFKANQNVYYKALYIALNNLLSLYIINMNLDKAKQVIEEIEQLKISKNNICFSRPEILENNTILYDFFSKKISIEKTESNFYNLYEGTKDLADNILIASNYAVILMLNGKLEKAKDVLLLEYDNVREDKEGIYYYRIVLNLAVCEFLIDNNNRETCLERLKKVKYNKEDPHYKVRLAELEGIIYLMSNIESCNHADIWCNAYKNNVKTVLNDYATYQQGLVYTTLFDWDDD